MSAAQPPPPEELQQEFPFSAEEAQAFAEAMGPVQDLLEVGASFGDALEAAPGPGNKLAGALLQQMAAQADLASVSIETIVRAMNFYIEAQVGTFEDLFPPPDVLAEQLQSDVEPLARAVERANDQPPF